MVQSRWVHELKLVFGLHCHSREVDLYRMGRQGRAAVGPYLHTHKGRPCTDKAKLPCLRGAVSRALRSPLTDHAGPRFFP